MKNRVMDKISNIISPRTSDKKSIFFVSLPKSGTVYTWNAVCDVTGLKIPEFHLLEGWSDYNSGRDFSCPKLYACGDYNTQMLLPDNMQYYSEGYFFGAHMQASYHNMKVLEESGIKRVVVLLRDPRDAFVSWVHHLRKLGPSARNYHSRIYHIPRDYYNWTLEKQFDYQVRAFLPNVINWVEGWLDYYASSDRKIDVLFVLYDELKRDPVNYVKKIVSYNELENADYSKVPVAEEGKLHYRKGEHGQWRVDFTEHNQRLADDLLQDRIALGYEKAALSHTNIEKSKRALTEGRVNDAGRMLLDVIEQFPNSVKCYELFFNVAELLGLDTVKLRELLYEELSNLPVEGYFIRRDELISACKQLFPSKTLLECVSKL